MTRAIGTSALLGVTVDFPSILHRPDIGHAEFSDVRSFTLTSGQVESSSVPSRTSEAANTIVETVSVTRVTRPRADPLVPFWHATTPPAPRTARRVTA